MFGFIGKAISVIGSTLFGGSGTKKDGLSFAQEAAKGVGSWIDEQQLTEQEGAEMRLAAGKMLIKAIESTKDENSVRSVTRRYLAWSIMGSFLFILMVSAITYKIDLEYSQFLFDLASKSLLGELAMAVGAFYFFAGIVRTAKG